MRRLVLAGVALSLAACGGASDPVSVSSTPTPSPTVSLTPAPAPVATVSPSSAPVATTAAPVASPAVLVLEADGLGELLRPGRVRDAGFAFTSAGDITALVKGYLGAGVTNQLPDCGQGPRSTYRVKGLSLLFDGKDWVGWSLDKGSPLSTVDGVKLGITYTKLKALRPKVMRSTESLGDEFYESDAAINGLLSGPKDTATVTLLYAGESCFFR